MTLTAASEDHGLLERTGELAALERSIAKARDGRGSLVLVSGEAGIGKTALVRAFCDAHRDGTRVLWGVCDPLFTPRPLGPLLDVAEVVGGELAELVQGRATPHDVTMALRRELGRRSPTIVVIDDAEWADEATIDVLRLLADRLEGVRAAVIVTYRDELDRWHPMRIVVGEIGAGQAITRVRLQPFSLQAVTSLAAGYGASPAELYDKTRGNPFFVTEVLGASDLGVPPTVRDAVLARAARLSPAARELLEAVAIAPSQTELWLLDTLIGDAGGRLEECVAGGMLTLRSGSVSFRHELARQALEAAIDEPRKVRLHRAVLAALTARTRPKMTKRCCASRPRPRRGHQSLAPTARLPPCTPGRCVQWRSRFRCVPSCPKAGRPSAFSRPSSKPQLSPCARRLIVISSSVIPSVRGTRCGGFHNLSGR